MHELEDEGKKWNGKVGGISISLSLNLEKWNPVLVPAACLAIKVPNCTRVPKCPLKAGGGCSFWHGQGVSYVPVPSTSLQRQKGKQEPTALHLHGAGVWPLTLGEFNNVTVRAIHDSPVTVSPETALTLQHLCHLDVSLYVCIHLFNIWKAHIIKIIVFQQIKIAFIIRNNEGERF